MAPTYMGMFAGSLDVFHGDFHGRDFFLGCFLVLGVVFGCFLTINDIFCEHLCTLGMVGLAELDTCQVHNWLIDL